jgi:hypothetical protein
MEFSFFIGTGLSAKLRRITGIYKSSSEREF